MKNFSELLKRAKQNDEAAILEIVEMYKPALVKNSKINDYFDEDLYQQLTLVILRCIRTFKE